jgi:hypothetical protein
LGTPMHSSRRTGNRQQQTASTSHILNHTLLQSQDLLPSLYCQDRLCSNLGEGSESIPATTVAGLSNTHPDIATLGASHFLESHPVESHSGQSQLHESHFSEDLRPSFSLPTLKDSTLKHSSEPLFCPQLSTACISFTQIISTTSLQRVPVTSVNTCKFNCSANTV